MLVVIVWSCDHLWNSHWFFLYYSTNFYFCVHLILTSPTCRGQHKHSRQAIGFTCHIVLIHQEPSRKSLRVHLDAAQCFAPSLFLLFVLTSAFPTIVQRQEAGPVWVRGNICRHAHPHTRTHLHTQHKCITALKVGEDRVCIIPASVMWSILWYVCFQCCHPYCYSNVLMLCSYTPIYILLFSGECSADKADGNKTAAVYIKNPVQYTVSLLKDNHPWEPRRRMELVYTVWMAQRISGLPKLGSATPPSPWPP